MGSTRGDLGGVARACAPGAARVKRRDEGTVDVELGELVAHLSAVLDVTSTELKDRRVLALVSLVLGMVSTLAADRVLPADVLAKARQLIAREPVLAFGVREGIATSRRYTAEERAELRRLFGIDGVH